MHLDTYMTLRPPTSPGEMLVEEFLKPLGLTQAELGERTGLGPRTINEICRGKRAITARTAIIFSDFFDMTVEFWLNLQRKTDLWKTLKEMGRLEQTVKSQPSLVVNTKASMKSPKTSAKTAGANIKKAVKPQKAVARKKANGKVTRKVATKESPKETKKYA